MLYGESCGIIDQQQMAQPENIYKVRAVCVEKKPSAAEQRLLMARQQALPSIENYREKKIIRLKKIIGLNRTSNLKEHRIKQIIGLKRTSS